MKSRNEVHFQPVLLAGVVFSILIILIYQFLPAPTSGNDQGVEARMFLSQSDVRKSAFEFKSIDQGYEVFNEARFHSDYKFAYLWVELINNEKYDKDIILLNNARNYYTELLRPERLGAVTLFRYGDIVPVSESPFKNDKPAFPVTVPSGEKLSVVIEYHGPLGLIIAPEIVSFSELFEQFNAERNYEGIICGIFIILLIINSINIIMLGWRSFYPVMLFIASVFLFYLRQSRILLLLIDPQVYPDWLFPVSIALNIGAAAVFISRLLEGYLNPNYRLILRTVWIISIVLGTLSIIGYPYITADLLNLLSLVLVPVAAIGLRGVMKKREWDILYIAISFLPWCVIALIDILSSFIPLDLRSAESMQASGMIVSMFLLSISLQNLNYRQHQNRIDHISGELELAQSELTRQMASVTEFRKSAIHKLGYQLRQPLDAIQSLTSILVNEYAFPEISSVCRLLSSETEVIKRIVDNEIEIPVNDEAGSDAAVFNLLTLRPWIDSSICIFDSDPVHASRTAMILRASGYEVRVVSDQYQALSLINSGKADVLVIDPTSTGETSFSLCGLVRSEFNMFEVPILMITDYHADFLMKKGYSAGVNDFLTTPFDSSELSARIQSLIKLKKIAKHNYDLAKSEKEKNTFLYFLTHNINTPLTLLLNRINELSEFKHDENLVEIADDLQAAGREIGDIVQNVLISFRLSDGRHTVRLNEIDIEAVVRAVEADLQGKADEKKQQLIVEVAADIPPVVGDRSALRGILYNLIDNGLKFSPEHGIVNVGVSTGESVSIRVKDNGPGIPEYEQGRLFERFQRLSPQPTAGESSTGLGLYVAYELARMNGGDLYYESGHDGACFVFTLPAAKEGIKDV